MEDYVEGKGHKTAARKSIIRRASLVFRRGFGIQIELNQQKLDAFKNVLNHSETDQTTGIEVSFSILEL